MAHNSKNEIRWNNRDRALLDGGLVEVSDFRDATFEGIKLAHSTATYARLDEHGDKATEAARCFAAELVPVR